MEYSENRRSFLKKTTAGVLGLSGLSAKSYSSVIGANDRINVAIAGINGRGNGHISAIQMTDKNTRIAALCDVDSRLFSKTFGKHTYLDSRKVTTFSDFRKLLENKDIDAVTIATPDHWHAPMAIMAMNAGKHVYLEKPFCHNPQEGEWVQLVQSKTKVVLQIGNQQRSAPTSIELKKEILNGVIGKPYYAKAWYSNNRKSIGKGKNVAVPDWLDWELWQGPAPRKTLKDNYVHYKWHWFWHWGTGEINNNGLHELDIARWMLGVDIPDKVTSSGGRFAFDDDWEFYDTQVTSFQFGGNKLITWEGTSCRQFPQHHNRGRGALIYGTEGSAIVDRDGYKIFDKKGNVIKQSSEKEKSLSLDIIGGGGLDNYHISNFLSAIRDNVPVNSPAIEAHKSTLLCHLGNMAQRFGGVLETNNKDGRPYNKQAMTLWSREYEQGWQPVI